MDIVHNFHIKTSAAQLYEAFTTEKGIKGWWSKSCDIGQTEGDTSRLRFKDDTVEMHFTIDTLRPYEEIIWLSAQNPNPSWQGTTIVIRITEAEEGVDLYFNHGNWDPKWKEEVPYTQTKGTWGHFMDSLKTYCEEGLGEPW